MKIALVFDDLIQYGGAEKLLLATTEIWPEAPLYTSLATPEWEKICKEKNIDLRTSFMQKFPFKKRLNRLYSVLGLHILAFESFDFSNFDLVLSVSARYAHGIITKPYTKHICYMNSPGRMFWESRDYFSYESLFIKFLNFLIRPFLSHARNWDFISAKRVDHFIANSPVPQKRIKKYYGRNSEVVFPPVEFPKDADKFLDSALQVQDYFLVITRLSSWKRVDIAVEACANLNLNLKVVGSGPGLKKLQEKAKKLNANSSIEFLGYVSEDEKLKLLRNCRAFIMTQKEDFGIAPLEAMSMGKPIIAYGKGGALVYVIPEKTGVFFQEQNSSSLQEILRHFNSEKYLHIDCMHQAQKFSKQKFQENLQDKVNKVYYKEI